MFEIGTIDHWWPIAKRFPILSKSDHTLKPLGYAHLINLIEAFQPQRVLEVGHGTGSYLFSLFSDKIEMWGLDDSIENNTVPTDSLALYRKNHPKIKFVSGVLGDYRFELPDNYFDLVCSVSVLQHIPGDFLTDVFADIFRMLKPGGIVSNSYDIPFGLSTRKVFDAYLVNGFEWLKPADTMNVFWEKWLGNFDPEYIEEFFEKIMTENPMVVAERFMWRIERNQRPSPVNNVTVLNAARKPDATVVATPNPMAVVSMPDPDNFSNFTYSKKTHFELCKKTGRELDANYTDVKSYQEMLVHSFIINNLDRGSRILEIGNNRPKLLNTIKGEYECTDILFPGQELTNISDSDRELINFPVGDLAQTNVEMQSDYFDFIFSTANLRDDKLNPNSYQALLDGILRVLKTKGICMLCFTSFWRGSSVYTPGFMKFLFNTGLTQNAFIHDMSIMTDKDLFFVTQKFYDDNWKKNTGKSYWKFGKPYSYNALIVKKGLVLSSPSL